ncbi:MAG TPA: di-heme oxidoredictase family protein [Burkholderiales bacterium]|nr:di-heme oxidoredictase family protein [Burkholderiales bacterium]
MRNHFFRLLVVACAAVPASALVAERQLLPPAALSGGALTVADASETAYSHPTALLDSQQGETFALGHRMFHNKWAFYWFENAEWGRGPTSNAEACATCHERNGRGRISVEPGESTLIFSGGEPGHHMVVRLSIPGESEFGPLPHPAYGTQLQTFGVRGVVPAEGDVTIEWREHPVTLPDGETVRLRSPKPVIGNLTFGPLGDEVLVSLRLAPPVFGLGLLEAVPEETLLAFAAREPVDGIRGRANYVWDVEQGRTVLGRFGLKANHPTLREQVAAAFIHDLGLSTPIYPQQNCPPLQKACTEQMPAGRPEIKQPRLLATELYIRALSVPARRNLDDPQVIRGEKLFAQARCAVCHVPEMTTGDFPPLPLLANQVIRPYTDLLLHDMGEGLADNRPDFVASGREWRTAPLWGIGLSETVNGASALLHDGRARNLTEAILWHGGTATISRDAFVQMPAEDRKSLLAFLKSL